MKSFEKTLSSIISRTDDGEILFSSDPDLPISDLRFLKAKHLVDLPVYGDDTFYVVLTDAGRTYFFDKSNELRHIVLNWTVNLFVSLASGLFGAMLMAIYQSH